MGWNGRKLTSIFKDGELYNYGYNTDGQRVSKSAGRYEYTYLYYGTKLMSCERKDRYTTAVDTLNFFYDDNDQPLGFYFLNIDTSFSNNGLGAKYYYVRNAQGDVVQIRNAKNEAIANYHYDAWGKLRSITDANGNKQSLINETFSYSNTSIACINPIRYRGYVYDNETGFYYLNTRYYDPSLRRFINADTTDILTATPDGLTDKNLYAYCDNNPVMRSDDGGDFWHVVAGAIIGAASSAISTAITGGDWKDVLISAGFGAASGALSAAIPGASAAISAGFSAVESVVQDIRHGEDVTTIATNAIVSAGFSAVGGTWDNPLTDKSTYQVFNTAKNYSKVAKKQAVKATKKFFRKLPQRAFSAIGSDVSLTLMGSGTSIVSRQYIRNCRRVRGR